MYTYAHKDVDMCKLLLSTFLVNMPTHPGVHRNLRSPRARHKVGLYVAKRQKTESGTEKKAIVAELMKLKDDGGLLDGGDHQETYNCKLLQKITKKEVQKEEEKKQNMIKEAKKFLGIQKMKATKLKKKKEKEELEAAAAAGGGAAAAPPASSSTEASIAVAVAMSSDDSD